MHALGPITPKPRLEKPKLDHSQQLQRKLYLAAKSSKERRFHAFYDRLFRPDVLWRVCKETAGVVLESSREKVVGKPYEGEPHVRFEVAGDGNQDRVGLVRHSQRKRGANR